MVKDSREVGMQSGPDFRLNERLTVLRAKDHMDQDFGEELGHSRCRQGLQSCGIPFPRPVAWADEWTRLWRWNKHKTLEWCHSFDEDTDNDR